MCLSAQEAVDETGANASVLYVPPPFAAQAILEGVDAGLGKDIIPSRRPMFSTYMPLLFLLDSMRAVASQHCAHQLIGDHAALSRKWKINILSCTFSMVLPSIACRVKLQKPAVCCRLFQFSNRCVVRALVCRPRLPAVHVAADENQFKTLDLLRATHRTAQSTP